MALARILRTGRSRSNFNLSKGTVSMLGWMLIFTLLSVTAALAGVTAGTGFNPGMAASLVFGFLLIASILTRALRGHS